MLHFLLFIMMTALVSCQAQEKTVTDFSKSDIYSKAIENYLEEVSAKKILTPDTLFFINRKMGHEDDFPDITLPKKIKGVFIVLMNADTDSKYMKENKSRIYINLFGWVEKDNSQFIFVTFNNGLQHKFDYTVNFVHTQSDGTFKKKSSHVKMFDK